MFQAMTHTEDHIQNRGQLNPSIVGVIVSGEPCNVLPRGDDLHKHLDLVSLSLCVFVCRMNEFIMRFVQIQNTHNIVRLASHKPRT